MDIKLKCRLSAYSKVATLGGDEGGVSNLPNPDETAAGSMLVVNENGDYTLIPKTNNTDIDNLFPTLVEDELVTKSEIDSLFGNSKPDSDVTKEDIDKLFPDRVSNAQIDTLFS